MALGDVGQLARLDAGVARALGARLTALDLRAAHAFVDDAPPQLATAFRPIRRYHLRGVDPTSIALKLWVYREPVPEDQARLALGDVPLEPLIEAGLLVRVDETLASPFSLSFSEGMFFFGDELGDGGDAVMALGLFTLEMMRATWCDQRVERVLDLGCGAGAVALYLAAVAERAIGTDINPRAAVFGAFNATLNGVANAEFRVGDLFAPMAGERFDLILSQPPFLPRPEGSIDATYMFGGPRGDELPLRALAETPAHLTETGRAVMIIQWGVFDDESVAARIRKVLPEDVDLLVLEAPSRSLDDAAIGDALTAYPGLGPAYEDSVLRRRAHYDALGCRSLVDTVVVVARTTARHGFTGTTRIERLEKGRCTRAHVDSLLAAHALASASDAALLDAHPSLPRGTAFVPEDEGFSAVFPGGALHERVPVTATAKDVLQLVAGARDLRAATKLFAQRHKVSASVATEQLLSFVRTALRSGLLELR